MNAIELTDVSVAYEGVTALEGVSLDVATGDWIGLIGPNGAGKTTLLRAIGGLLSFSGDIRVGDAMVKEATRRALSKLMAFLPQRPVLPLSMTVIDYVLLGRTPYISYLGTETAADLEEVRVVLERLDLVALADRALGQLSGGESQRAVLGRALAQRTPVLLLDEPTAALDVGHQQHVLELIDDLRAEQALTVIAAMHDLTLAAQFARRLVLLSGGRKVLEGPAKAVLTEATIAEHYGAFVRILEDSDGAVLVAPTRSLRRRLVSGQEALR